MSLPLLSAVEATLIDTLNQETIVISRIHMESNPQPIGGEMSISPTEGSAGYTKFTLTLTDEWDLGGQEDSEDELFYQLWGREAEGAQMFRIGEDGYRYPTQLSIEVTLPKLEVLEVEIFGTHGDPTFYPLNVSVVELPASENLQFSMDILNEVILTNVVTEIKVALNNGESFTDRPNLDVSFFLNPLPERYVDRA
jgi:hypothetical protein